MENNLLQLGATAIIFLFAVREFFSYLKARKENGTNSVSAAILSELRKMNENHLHALERAINEGNDKIVEAINASNTRQVELLGEIKGKLSR